jgi:hypothetical protein
MKMKRRLIYLLSLLAIILLISYVIFFFSTRGISDTGGITFPSTDWTSNTKSEPAGQVSPNVSDKSNDDSFRGTVLDFSSKSPVAGASVSYVLGDGVSPILGEKTTDKSGLFTIVAELVGKNIFKIAADDYAPLSMVLTFPVIGTEKTFYLKKNAGISGQISGEKGAKIEEARVRLFARNKVDKLSARSTFFIDTVSDFNGKYQFKGVDPGFEYVFVVVKEGYSRVSINQIRFKPGEDKELNVILPQGASIYGRIVRRNGRSPLGTVIRLYSRKKDARNIFLQQEMCRANKTGRFRMPFVEEGYKWLEAINVESGYGEYYGCVIDIKPGDRIDKDDIILGEKGRIYGNVMLDDSSPASESTVKIIKVGTPGAPLIRVPVDENGKYEVVGFGKGAFHISVEPQSGYKEALREFVKGDIIEMDFSLERLPDEMIRKYSSVEVNLLGSIDFFEGKKEAIVFLGIRYIRCIANSIFVEKRMEIPENNGKVFTSKMKFNVNADEELQFELSYDDKFYKSQRMTLEPDAKKVLNVRIDKMALGGSVSGAILTSDEHIPIEGAIIRRLAIDERYKEEIDEFDIATLTTAKTSTGKKGEFVLKGLPRMTRIVIHISKEGYKSKRMGIIPNSANVGNVYLMK